MKLIFWDASMKFHYSVHTLNPNLIYILISAHILHVTWVWDFELMGVWQGPTIFRFLRDLPCLEYILSWGRLWGESRPWSPHFLNPWLPFLIVIVFNRSFLSPHDVALDEESEPFFGGRTENDLQPSCMVLFTLKVGDFVLVVTYSWNYYLYAAP